MCDVKQMNVFRVSKITAGQCFALLVMIKIKIKVVLEIEYVFGDNECFSPEWQICDLLITDGMC